MQYSRWRHCVWYDAVPEGFRVCAQRPEQTRNFSSYQVALVQRSHHGGRLAVAVLLALKAFQGESPLFHRKVQILPPWTDNRGNGAAVNKRMSTRYLVNADIAAHMKTMGMKALTGWTPRTGNREAHWRVLPEGAEDGTSGRGCVRAKERGELPQKWTKAKARRSTPALLTLSNMCMFREGCIVWRGSAQGFLSCRVTDLIQDVLRRE